MWLTVATPQCVVDDFDGEIVALNLNSGVYYSMRDLAGAVWRDLAAGHAPDEVVAALAAVGPDLGRDAGVLIGQLREFGLMRQSAAPPASVPALESAARAANGLRGIAIEAFEDMKDLVMTDPIHEVDEETGWPVAREGGP